MPTTHLNRRDFIRQSAVTGAALSLSASSYENVRGANDRFGVAFLGCGARVQAHIDVVVKHPELTPIAVCDVWDGLDDTYIQERGGRQTQRRYRQGLYPSAKRAGLNPADKTRVTKDYRHALELRDVDLVCIGTPDHWHARMTIDALMAGKHVFCETPLCRTLPEADAVLDTWKTSGRVMTVGCQSLANPSWALAHELIAAGRIGHVAQLQAGAYRNDSRGYWRFYRIHPSQNPNTIDWPMFLGQGFSVANQPIGPDLPFDRARFAQWRCDAAFGGGIFTDLLIHPVTRLLRASGLGQPSRVVGTGGLFLERDGRDVADVVSLIADFPERCQLIVTGSTITAYPVEEVIRGRLGTLKFVKGAVQVIADSPEGGTRLPARLESTPEPTETISVDPIPNETLALWDDLVGAIRTGRRDTLCPPTLAADALSILRRAYEDCPRV